jgi:hypothetical protein
MITLQGILQADREVHQFKLGTVSHGYPVPFPDVLGTQIGGIDYHVKASLQSIGCGLLLDPRNEGLLLALIRRLAEKAETEVVPVEPDSIGGLGDPLPSPGGFP